MAEPGKKLRELSLEPTHFTTPHTFFQQRKLGAYNSWLSPYINSSCLCLGLLVTTRKEGPQGSTVVLSNLSASEHHPITTHSRKQALFQARVSIRYGLWKAPIWSFLFDPLLSSHKASWWKKSFLNKKFSMRANLSFSRARLSWKLL